MILYAGWLEHWVNMVVSVGMLRGGCEESAVEKYFQTQPRFDEKLQRVRIAFAVAPLEKKQFDWIVQVMEDAQCFLALSVEGRPKADIEKESRGVAALVRKSDSMLVSLLRTEHLNFDAPFETLSSDLFPQAR